METFREGALAYQLHTWYDGEALAEALTRLYHSEQFSVSKKTSEWLRKLHSLPPFEETDNEPWGIHFKRRMKSAIQFYADNPVKSKGADLLSRCLKDNQDLLDNRPLAFTHGDCNTGNFNSYNLRYHVCCK